MFQIEILELYRFFKKDIQLQHTNIDPKMDKDLKLKANCFSPTIGKVL